jgi:hypothetical protein
MYLVCTTESVVLLMLSFASEKVGSKDGTGRTLCRRLSVEEYRPAGYKSGKLRNAGNKKEAGQAIGRSSELMSRHNSRLQQVGCPLRLGVVCNRKNRE